MEHAVDGAEENHSRCKNMKINKRGGGGVSLLSLTCYTPPTICSNWTDVFYTKHTEEKTLQTLTTLHTVCSCSSFKPASSHLTQTRFYFLLLWLKTRLFIFKPIRGYYNAAAKTAETALSSEMMFFMFFQCSPNAECLESVAVDKILGINQCVSRLY